MMQSKTWWGKRFINALEEFTDTGRLSRGRAYSSDKRILKWDIINGEVSARLLGNKNPYFGVYKAPKYKTSLKMKKISTEDWKQIIKLLSNKSGFIAKLMMNEMPDNIEVIFRQVDKNLLPHSYGDFDVQCSCPDYAVPCKHIAGICYRLGKIMDSNPLILFELRGLPPEQLKKELAKSALGKVLLQSMKTVEKLPKPATSYYTRPKKIKPATKITAHNYWYAEKPLTNNDFQQKETPIPAIVIKKGGDYPTFWNKQSSFIDVMEEFYLRLRKNSQKFR